MNCEQLMTINNINLYRGYTRKQVIFYRGQFLSYKYVLHIYEYRENCYRVIYRNNDYILADCNLFLVFKSNNWVCIYGNIPTTINNILSYLIEHFIETRNVNHLLLSQNYSTLLCTNVIKFLDTINVKYIFVNLL